MNILDLKGRRAVITGGARGMGFAFAKRFLESGASVALWDVNAEALARAKAALDPLGQVAINTVDVSDYAQVEAAAASVAKTLGGIEILVNAAGIAGVNVPVTDYPLNSWNAVMNVNLNGIFYTCRAIVPYMQQSDYGRIVNIARWREKTATRMPRPIPSLRRV